MNHLPKLLLIALFPTGWVAGLAAGYQVWGLNEKPAVIHLQEIQVDQAPATEKQGKLEQCPICGVTGRRVELEIVPEK